MFRTLAISGLAVLALPSIAAAEGSVSLRTLMPLVAQSPQLVQQLGRVLGNTHETIESITCVGMRLGPQFGSVSAAPIGPYTCTFGTDTTLTLQAETSFLNLSGQAVDPTETSEEVLVLERLTGWNWK